MARAAVAAVLIGLAPAARAQDPYLPPPADDAWRYDLAFYLWLTQMDGELESRGLEVEVDADYKDVLDNLDSTVAFRFEAWHRDSFGIGFDISWLELEDEPEFATGEGKVEADFGFTELTVAGRTRSGNAYVDAFGGVRWVRFESGLEAPDGRDEEESTDYFDPMIGLRVGFQASSWLHGSLRFDVSGFGIGTDRTGNLVLIVDFKVGPRVAVSTGWRTMAVEIDEDRQKLDLLLSGPVLAVLLTF
jgi:hypothetical protein